MYIVKTFNSLRALRKRDQVQYYLQVCHIESAYCYHKQTLHLKKKKRMEKAYTPLGWLAVSEKTCTFAL